MKVLYDEQTVLTQSMGGVSRYFANLMAMMAASGVNARCLLSSTTALEDSGNVYALQNKHCFQKPAWYWRAGAFLLQKIAPAQLRRLVGLRQMLQFADVVHAGQFCYVQGALIRHAHLVTTVHDMIHENYYLKLQTPPQGAAHYSYVKQCYVEHSTQIIAISHFTKQELMRLWSVPEEKITVVHHANPFEGIEVPAREVVEHPYLLFVGTRGYYKNFVRFVEASAEVLHKKPGLKVICTGNQPFSEEELALLEKWGVAGRFETKSVSEAELIRLYVNAELFCFPSLMEGFGLPILEAFTCGCPVCCAEATCFPEVAGEAAAYFNPESAEDMAAAMLRVLDDYAYRARLIEAGLQRTALFSRKKLVEETMQVYCKCRG